MIATKTAFNFFVEPRSALVEQKENPTFWFPIFSIILLSISAIAIYFYLVDIDWLNEHLLSLSPAPAAEPGTSGEDAPQMGKGIMMWMSITTIVIGFPILRLVESAYYFLAGKITNIEYSFKYCMSLSCWSSLPLAIVIIVSVAFLAVHPNGQVTQEQLNVFSLNELLFNVRPDHDWYSFLNALTILHPWVWWLVAFGVKISSGRSWQFSIAFSLIPWIFIYGVWALIAAI